MKTPNSTSRLLHGATIAVVTAAVLVALLPTAHEPPSATTSEQPGGSAVTAETAAAQTDACPPGYVTTEAFLAEERSMERMLPGDQAETERDQAEREAEEADRDAGGCIAEKHPEGYTELALAARDHASPRLAPTGNVDGAAFAAALDQRQAMATTDEVQGTKGSASQYARGPLVVDDERYGPSSQGLVNDSGRTDDLEYDPDHNRLFAAVGSGGVWMSEDLGGTWTNIGDTMPSTVVGSVAWTKANGGTLIAVTGDPTFGGISGYPGYGVYYTNDLGGTWHKASGVPDGALGFRVAVDPSDASHVFVATGLGLFRSTDGGHSFTNANLDTGDCKGVTDINAHPDCLLANVVTDVVVQQPGGATNITTPKVVAAVGWRGGNFKNPDGSVQSPANGIYVSDKGGAPGTFTRTTGGTGSGFASQDTIGRIEMGAARGPQQDHAYLYAMVQDAQALNGAGCAILDAPVDCSPQGAPTGINTMLEGVYVSSDFGASWTRVASASTFQDPTAGSALTGTASALGYQPGVQAWYNQFILPDPTQQVGGIPTRLVLGLEEVWENEASSLPVIGPSKFKVIGRYFAGETCLFLNPGLPACPTNRPPTNSTTTHPDQHSVVFIPNSDGGVSLFVGNDGGVFRQDVAAGEDFDNTKWGGGAVQGFHTLLPYHAEMARDGVVWFGLQDNGSGKIVPKEGYKQYETFGGDGFYSAVDPNNSDIAYTETPAAAMTVTTDGGKSSTAMAPPPQGGPYRFSNPFVMDPNDALHLMTGGSRIYETQFGPGTTTPPDPSDPTAGSPQPSDWKEVFDLGTQKHRGDPDAEPTADDPINQMSALDLERNAAYVGFCGVCDILNATAPFRNGIATNVAGDKPMNSGTSDGWHVAAAKGLPNRFITGVAIDPQDVHNVYVTLGGYSRKWVGPGTLQDDNPNVGTGHVFKSTDAGETFTDISGNLPDAPAVSLALRGNQVIVGTDVGVFSTGASGAPTWAALDGLPPTPVGNVSMKPHDPNLLTAALFGRGVWTYAFDAKRPVVEQHRVAGSNRLATAIQVSREQHPHASTVVIARADNYADALAGAPLAWWKDAPILLSYRDGLDAATKAEVTRLGARTAYVLGGTAALSPQVEADLKAAGVTTVTRVAGSTRFATAAKIGDMLPNKTHAYVVKGADADPSKGWADALAVGPLAAEQGRPILLTTTDTLPSQTATALDDLGVKDVTFVGGTAAISKAVRDAVAKKGVKTKSIAGSNRFDTAAKVAEVAQAAGLSDFRMWLATGSTFPDALSAGPSIAANGGTLLLVPTDDLDHAPDAKTFLVDHVRDIEGVRYVGGTAAISSKVASQVDAIIKAGPQPEPPPPPLTGKTLAGPFTFDTGADGWTTSSNDPATMWRAQPPGDNSPQAFTVSPYNNEATASLTSPAFDFPGGSVKLSWTQKVNTEDGFDFLTVEWSSDGETYHGLGGFSGMNADYPLFTKQEKTFVAPKGKLIIRFRLSSDQLVNGEGAAVDNVKIDY